MRICIPPFSDGTHSLFQHNSKHHVFVIDGDVQGAKFPNVKLLYEFEHVILIFQLYELYII